MRFVPCALLPLLKLKSFSESQGKRQEWVSFPKREFFIFIEHIWLDPVICSPWQQLRNQGPMKELTWHFHIRSRLPHFQLGYSLLVRRYLLGDHQAVDWLQERSLTYQCQKISESLPFLSAGVPTKMSYTSETGNCAPITIKFYVLSQAPSLLHSLPPQL